MKKVTLLLIMLALTTVVSIAQKQIWVLPQYVPQGINYQAAVRDNSGNALANTAVSFRVSILKGKNDGPSQYTETHEVTTNAHGLANFVIFGGTRESGNFNEITWTQEGPYFLKVEMDSEGGSNYQLMGTSEMLSVPYALNANYSLYAYSSGPTYEVGQLAEGGIVIATWDGGRHGWVAALEDLSKRVSHLGAVRLVQADTTGGYRDWVLPNTAQLKLMYEQRAEIGGFTSTAYWSSNNGNEFQGRWGGDAPGEADYYRSAVLLIFNLPDYPSLNGQEYYERRDYSSIGEKDEDGPPVSGTSFGVRAVRVF